MRYHLTDFEWSVLEPQLPKNRRGVKPRNNRRVLNGIFCILRSGSPWRDLPERYEALHHRLQPLQSLAKGRHLGPADGCRRKRT
jgi:transposase